MAKPKQEYEKRDYHQELTDKVLARMQEAKDQKWTKPWFSGPPRRPMNAMTGKAYSGCNQLTLSLSGYDDHRWFTFNGIKQHGAKHELDLSIKGEKGTTVFKAFMKEFKSGACQGSCRVIHAARSVVSTAGELTVTRQSRSGLRVTGPIGDQLRV